MAILRIDDVASRIKAIIAAKFDTYAALVNSNFEEHLRNEVLKAPPDYQPDTPCAAVFFQSQEIEDMPQETGSVRGQQYKIECYFEAPEWNDANAEIVHDLTDIFWYMFVKENRLLDPDTGEKLQWLWRAWPTSCSVEWLPYEERRGGLVLITTILLVTVDEGESY